MGLTDRLAAALPALFRSTYPPVRPAYDNLWPYVNMGGNTYPLMGLATTMPASKQEEPSRTFSGLAGAGYGGNGVVFACILSRLQIFSQARFQFQRLRNGRPDDFFGTAALAILERPWPGGTTGDLLAQMEVDASLAGNGYITRRDRGLRRLRPDWVSIILGSESDETVDSWDIDATPLGYVYYPGGPYSGREPEILRREEVAHFAPIPDPMARYKGMSWVSPIVREMMGDTAATAHKLQFFENGATPNLVVKRADSVEPEKFERWVQLMEDGHRGTANAYKTLYLDSGADATVVGRDLQQLDFKVTQGAGETRIAAAAGVHPVVVGLSEGMQGSSLNAGNFASARRLVADKTLWHLWSSMAGSLETLVPAPSGSRLWVDPRDVPFLREDRKDAAEIQDIKARTIRTLTDGGYEPSTVLAAVEAEDMNLLKWTGLVSVQLQPPGRQPSNGTAPEDEEVPV